jgi:hypothetical protein
VAVLVYPWGDWGNFVTCGTHLLVLWSVCLLATMAVAAPNFLSVMCCGEAFPSLGVQGVEVLILICALFSA